MGAGRGDGETDALGTADEFPSSAKDLFAKFGHVVADPRAHFDDRLMQLPFDLLAEGWSAGRQQLGDVRSELPRLRIDDLEFLFDAHREAVCHTAR